MSPPLKEIKVNGYKFARIKVGAHQQHVVFFYATDPARRSMALYAFWENVPGKVQLELDEVMIPGVTGRKSSTPLHHSVAVYGTERPTGGATFTSYPGTGLGELVGAKLVPGKPPQGSVTVVNRSESALDRPADEHIWAFQVQAEVDAGNSFVFWFAGRIPDELFYKKIRGHFGMASEEPYDPKKLRMFDDWIGPYFSGLIDL